MDPFGLTPVPSVTCLVNESAGLNVVSGSNGGLVLGDYEEELSDDAPDFHFTGANLFSYGDEGHIGSRLSLVNRAGTEQGTFSGEAALTTYRRIRETETSGTYLATVPGSSIKVLANGDVAIELHPSPSAGLNSGPGNTSTISGDPGTSGGGSGNTATMQAAASSQRVLSSQATRLGTATSQAGSGDGPRFHTLLGDLNAIMGAN